MRPFESRSLLLTTLAVALLATTGLHATDWTDWRGPGRSGVSEAEGVFPESGFGLDIAWRRPLGIAYSGISISGERAVTLHADGEFDWVTAFEPSSGRELWRYKMHTMFEKIGGSDGGPLSMPVIDGERVFVLGPRGELLALGLADGEPQWSRQIAEELDGRMPRFGFTTQPLVVGKALFVQTGAEEGRSLTAFDKATGDILWSVGDDPVGYQSPVLATLAGREQIVAVTNPNVHGLDPATGEVLWSHPHDTAGGRDGSASPVLLGDDRFLLTGQNDSSAFEVRREDGGFEVREIWKETSFKRSFATPVLYEGQLYGFDGDFLTCVDPSNGKKIWKSRPPGGRGLILVDGHLVMFSNDGEVVVAEASPEGYVEKARVEVSEFGGYTYPSFAGELIFVRNIEDMAAIRISDAPAPKRAGSASSGPRNDFERFLRRVESAEPEQRRWLIDDYMASRPGFPIVEDDRWVHFVWRGEVEDVAILGGMLEFRREEPMNHLPETDLYWVSYEIEPGARWEYRFNVDFEHVRPDPLNPRRVPGGDGDWSEVRTSEWQAPEHLRPYEGRRPGRLDRFEFHSDTLDNDREISVWLPPGYDDGGKFPLVLVNDGADWLDMANLTNTLNHLTGSELQPLVVAFVTVPDRAGRNELAGDKSAEYATMVADELVPELERRYSLSKGPETRAILGVGRGAVMAAYAALEHPQAFGKVGALSAYLPAPFGPQMLEEIEKSKRAAPRFHVSWNRYELRREEWNLDVGRDSRDLSEALREAGYGVEGGEVIDGSGWGGWRVRAAELLTSFFPSGS